MLFLLMYDTFTGKSNTECNIFHLNGPFNRRSM